MGAYDLVESAFRALDGTRLVVDVAAGQPRITLASDAAGASPGPLAEFVHHADGRALTAADLQAASETATEILVHATATRAQLRATRLPGDLAFLLELVDHAAAPGEAFLTERTMDDPAIDWPSLFAGLLDGASALYATIVDRQLRLVYYNRAYFESFTFPSNFGVGRTLSELLPADTAAALGERYLRVMETGVPEVWEYLAPPTAPDPTAEGNVDEMTLAPEARRRTVLVHSFALRDARGDQIVATANLSMDISERLWATEEARLARADAERASRAMSEFMARVSHELRTPLNAIVGFGQLLEVSHLDEPAANHTRRILSSARHLSGLITDVLEISSQRAGREQVSLAPVSVSAAIDEAVELVTPLLGDRTLTADSTRDRGTFAMADPQRLRQVLVNLLTNAIKYGGPSGHIALRVQTVAGRVRFLVSDTGPGIPPQDSERIFLPFERLDRDAAHQGTGLGLALSRSLTEAMGGTLRLIGSDGTGATFAADLAVSQPPSYERPHPAVPAELRWDLGPCTVLYIDDNVANAELVDRILERSPQTRSLLAYDGESGLALARSTRPDAILLDAHLPDIHGTEVLRRLRDDPPLAQTPVVILTADVSPASVAEFLALGVSDVIAKPLHIDRLLTTLRMALAGAAS